MESVHEPLQAVVQTFCNGRKNEQTKRTYEPQPLTPYARLPASAEIPSATKAKLRATLEKFFTVLGNLHCASTKPWRVPPFGNI